MCSCEVLSILERVVFTVTQIITAGGVWFAFSKWKLTRRQNRSELLRTLEGDFFENEVIQRVMTEDSTLESWEDLGIAQERRRQAVEKAINLITHICYLRANELIEDGEFILFQDTIDRVLSTPCILGFLCDEYKRVGEKSAKGRYHYLFAYLEKAGRSLNPSVDESPTSRSKAEDHWSSGPVEVEEFTEPTMIIKISRAYREGMSDDDIREATQGWWRITPGTANKAKLILAVANGMVKGVYRRSGPWQKDETGDHDGRYRFDGRAADDSVVRKFKDRSVAELFPKGASNPIRYFFPDQRS